MLTRLDRVSRTSSSASSQKIAPVKPYLYSEIRDWSLSPIAVATISTIQT